MKDARPTISMKGMFLDLINTVHYVVFIHIKLESFQPWLETKKNGIMVAPTASKSNRAGKPLRVGIIHVHSRETLILPWKNGRMESLQPSKQ